MARWGILPLICVAFIFVEARFHQKRETKSHLCDPVYNNTNKIQCYCIKDTRKQDLIRSAECSLTDEIPADDDNWNSFDEIESVGKLSFRNARAITFKYIPTNALKHTKALSKLELKYGNIEVLESFAFANLSLVREITLTDNHIKVLKPNAFAHHKELVTVVLDMNEIVEINRDVFVDLPALEKIYLTSNKITTIHDRAFVHLVNLRDLQIDTNMLFSLNSETFAGLKKLEKLDLSSNSLEVIGDSTFLPLKNLQSLNLDGNNIQMLDEKAFNGLVKLRSLSLAHNKLTDIDNVKVFKDLKSLTLLNFKGNQLRILKSEVISPVLHNFYNNISSLNVDDNDFPCDCRIDWFVSLMNKTGSPHLKLSVENMKCTPSNELRDKWIKVTESDKKDEEDQDNTAPSDDYEYYDESQLNGKLFYTDVRFLLNCSDENAKNIVTSSPPSTLVKQTKDTKELKASTAIPETTTTKNRYFDMGRDSEIKDPKEKQSSYTTSRLATVSAKPVEKNDNIDIKQDTSKNGNKYDDREMASDEAKPDKIKAHSFRDIKDHDYNGAIKTAASAYALLAIFINFI
ncbi:reticulon/nogo receptor [Danaus plexippus plexippus]|uniref:Reticulon/nogo receptor n=1 Tax=Danaus plexippus plexippus TaxID=278856 RepID=A0A212ELE1_DANPL|nr:reticulon/nogo receptor [Danaus plexippus plexippus]